MKPSASDPVPTSDLISPDFSIFSRSLVMPDGVLDVYLNRQAGPVSVSGGDFGPQTIQALAMDASLADFLEASLNSVDRQIGLNIRIVDRPELADVRFYLDTTIDLGGTGVTLGISLPNELPDSRFWEVILNTPELSADPTYLSFAALHELGHTLGLEHPFDNADGDVYVSASPYRSAYPEQTVMSYRDPKNGDWPQFYSSSDVAALRSIWGPEPPQDRLIGTSGADLLTGGAASEALQGLAGPDQMRGGAGSNWFSSPTDSSQDWILISRDGSGKIKRSAKTLDIITQVGREDRIAILNAQTKDLSYDKISISSLVYGPVDGIGIFASGRLEALYTGGDLSRSQLSQLTLGLPTDTLA